MDELLNARVEQLREIDDRLEAMQRWLVSNPDASWMKTQIRQLRREVARMIQIAEAEHAAF